MTPYEQPAGAERKMETLHDEIRQWAKEEGDPDAERINLDHLTMSDIAIAQPIHNGKITLDSFDAYVRQMREELADAPEDIKESRVFFSRIAGNKANQVIYG